MSLSIPSRRNCLLAALSQVGYCFYIARFILIFIINSISIPGEADKIDEEFETADVERRFTAKTELDLPTESLGKMIDIIEINKKK